MPIYNMITPVNGGGQTTTWYGESVTSASSQNKLVSCAGFVLTEGAIIGVLFINGNTSDAVYLNVNNTGNKRVYIGISPVSSSQRLYWSANTLMYFVYHDNQFMFITSMTDGLLAYGAGTWQGTSSTSAGTQAKTSSITNYTLRKGALISITFSTANTANAPMLNINNTGSKAIYKGGVITSASNPLKWGANETLTFMYDGTYYQYLASSADFDKQDKLVSGTNIKTVNGNSLLGSGNINISGGGGSSGWNNVTSLVEFYSGGSGDAYENGSLLFINVREGDLVTGIGLDPSIGMVALNTWGLSTVLIGVPNYTLVRVEYDGYDGIYFEDPTEENEYCVGTIIIPITGHPVAD